MIIRNESKAEVIIKVKETFARLNNYHDKIRKILKYTNKT